MTMTWKLLLGAALGLGAWIWSFIIAFIVGYALSWPPELVMLCANAMMGGALFGFLLRHLGY